MSQELNAGRHSSREDVVQALLQQRRSALAGPSTSADGRAFAKHERVKQLLQQRKGAPKYTDAYHDDGLDMAGMQATFGVQHGQGERDELVSPGSSTSFEFDQAAAHSSAVKTRGSDASPSRSSPDRAGVHAAPGLASRGQGVGMAAIPEAGSPHGSARKQPGRPQAGAYSLLGRSMQTQTVGRAPVASPNAAEQQPRSLAQIEQLLSEAMGTFSLERNPAALGRHDGPFDISEMWGASAGASPHSASQSHSQTQSDASGLQGQAEVSSGPSQRQAAPTRVGPAAGKAAKAAKPVPAAAAGVRKAPPPVPAPARPAARPRPASAPRLRPAAPAHDDNYMHPSQYSAASGKGPKPSNSSAVQFTFKPQINQSSREMVRQRYPSDREERIAQLAVPKPVLMQKYELVRKEVEEGKLKECTFTPRTGRPPSPVRVPPDVPVYDRLYQAKPAWQDKRELLLREREESEVARCTFQPRINQKRSQSAGRVPLHQRVADVLRNKNESLSNARIRMELADEGLTFKPSVNRKSVQLALKKQVEEGLHGHSAGERLYKQHQEKKRDFDTRDQEYTFAPHVNKRSEQLLNRSTELPASFLQRQEYLAALAAEKKQLYRSLVEEAECKFKPSLRASTSAPLGKGSWTSDSGDDQDRITKLAYQDVRRSEALKDALAEHYYGQYTFTPDINPRSRAIGKHHSVEELYRNDQGALNKERAVQAVKVQAEEELTFRPALNQRSLRVAEKLRRSGGGGLLDGFDAEHMAKVRAARLQDARAIREYEELKECTFTPEINRGTPNTKVRDQEAAAKPVPGMARYLELKEMAARKKEEERKRQEEVWWQKPRGNDRLYTVPQPFSFEERQAQLQEAHREEQEAANAAAAAAQMQQQQQQLAARQGQRNSLQRILRAAEMLGV